VTAREAGNLRRQAFALWTVAALAVASGEPERAVRLDAAASAAAESIGAVLAQPVRQLYDALLAPAHRALGEDGVVAARQAGRGLALRQAVDDALTWLAEDAGRARLDVPAPAGGSVPSAAVSRPSAPDHSRPSTPGPAQATPDAPDVEVLTPREREIAALIARGLTSREIAARLVIGKGTADAHADHIRGKLGLRSRAEIAAWAVSHGLLETPPA
jgi:non-specific serine/threonine protein kinase